MDILLDPFFLRALVGGVLIGVTAPLIGIFLVLRRLSMIGDTLSHVSIAGVALGMLVGVYPLGMGLVFALAASFAIEKLRKEYKTYAELSIAIIMSAGIALATLFFSLGRGFNISASGYLFGSIYTLDRMDLLLVGLVTAVTVLFVVFNFKEMFLLFFDEEAAAVSGLPIRFYNVAVTMLTALVISVAIKIVGALLVSSLVTIPVAASLRLAKSFKHSVILAAVFSELAVILGLTLAAWFNLAPGATIVLLLIVFLLGTFVIKRKLRV